MGNRTHTLEATDPFELIFTSLSSTTDREECISNLWFSKRNVLSGMNGILLRLRQKRKFTSCSFQVEVLDTWNQSTCNWKKCFVEAKQHELHPTEEHVKSTLLMQLNSVRGVSIPNALHFFDHGFTMCFPWGARESKFFICSKSCNRKRKNHHQKTARKMFCQKTATNSPHPETQLAHILDGSQHVATKNGVSTNQNPVMFVNVPNVTNIYCCWGFLVGF